MKKICVGKDFHRFPGGRFPRHGPGNGEDFREKFILPSLVKDEALEIVLDDAAGFPASFLEEAFGGLVRAGIDAEKIRRLLTISVTDRENEVYREEAWQYIDDAMRRKVP